MKEKSYLNILIAEIVNSEEYYFSFETQWLKCRGLPQLPWIENQSSIKMEKNSMSFMSLLSTDELL